MNPWPREYEDTVLSGRRVADGHCDAEHSRPQPRLEAFDRTLSSRVAKAPKLHMVDTGLAATSLGVTRRKPEVRDTAALTEFGHLVETFTVNELIKQAGWAETNVELSHFRGPRMLRDKLGSEFVGEAVLNLGTHSYHYDERLYMMPLDRLWTPTATAADP